MCVQLLSPNPWTVARQPPLSVGFPRQEEYWSGLPFPSPGHLINPGVKPASPVSPARAGGFFTVVPPGKQRGTEEERKDEEKGGKRGERQT